MDAISIFNQDLSALVMAVGYLGIFLIIFAESGLFFGFFLPGDTLLFTAGLMASQGYLSIVPLVLVIMLGAILGDQVGYLFGKKFGPKIFNRDDSFYFKKKHVENAEKFYAKHGRKTVLLARFMPVIRTFIPILAGVGNMKYSIFLTYNIAGGIIWGAGITLLGYFMGEKIPNLDMFLIPILIFVVFVSMLPSLFSYIYSKIKNKSENNG